MLIQWQLKDFDVGRGSAENVAYGRDESGWVEVMAPGDTHVALVAAGRVGHPFVGRNEPDAAWIADREWWWRTRFESARPVSGEHVELVFEGLDTFARIYLNGVLLGRADNMFRAWRFDVSEHLKNEGLNEIAIAFAPASQAVADRKMPLWGPLSERLVANKRNFMRKAQFGWGWDWGPNLPTVGVWEPVRIERWTDSRIIDVRFVVTTLSESAAEVRVDVDVAAAAAGLRAQVTLRDPEGATVAEGQTAGEGPMTVTLAITKPRLWWTADLGAQPLYTVDVKLMRGNHVVDGRSRQVGLRTLTLDQSEDTEEPGARFFRFVLNGVPIFARGACWIPASSFVGAVDEDHYRKLLEQAVGAHMNMLRVWGGGVYEHDAFYDLCDRLGLLVWQDFMFACAPYPEDDAAFVENVRQEIRHQILRLRHHACLALWCGNNEGQVLQDFFNVLTGQKTTLAGTLYYDRVMPELVAESNPETPYWPGSPSGGPSPNSMRAGDVHNWTVWHGIPPVPDDQMVGGIDRTPAGVAYTRYAEDMGRFISEFGIHSAPAESTLRRWMDADDLELGRPGFLERIKDEPKDKVNAMLLPVTGLPRTLAEYIVFTMFVQAEGLKFGLEHFRRRKPHCSGTLIWQFNDCWPCVSWSLVDYDGVGKASLYSVGRAYAPVLASFKPLEDGAVELWITNDTLNHIQGTALVEQLRFAGGTDWTASVDYRVPANGSIAIWSGMAPASTERVLRVHSAEGGFLPNRHLLAPVKDLALVVPASPIIGIKQHGPHELEVYLQAPVYLLFVHLTAEHATVRFSDNYFDLCAGESRIISVIDKTRALTPEAVNIACWNDRVTGK